MSRILLLFMLLQLAYCQDIITTIAGTGSATYSGDGSQATSAALNNPWDVAVDSSGNVYIADYNNNRIRKVTVSTGIITTFAGTGTASYSGDNGQASSAALNNPAGVTLDSSGNVYIADTFNCRIRKVVSTGIITTIAGSSTCSFSGDNGAATSAEMYFVRAVAIDSSGNAYIADDPNHRVRKVTVSTGIITTIAGTGGTGTFSGDGGQATSAGLYFPYGVAVDSSGNVYIGDAGNQRIRKVTVSTGIISTFAGTGSGSYSGDNGLATSAALNGPRGVWVDTSGNVFIADTSNHRIRKVTVSTGIITTIAGTGTGSYSGDNGAATSAALYDPNAVTVDASGNVYIADNSNNRIRKVTAVSTTSPSMSPTLVPSTAALSVQPTYYPSLSPHSIRVISTIAGTGTGSFSGDGNQATSATINVPAGLAIDSSGNVFFCDVDNHRIRKITVSSGIITTYAGNGAPSYSGDNGQATSAALYNPIELCVDSSGNIYISDSLNHRIRKVTASTSIIATIVGTGASSYSGDGGLGTSATLDTPIGVAVDVSGNLYIADCYNHRVRKLTVSTSILTTIGGNGATGYSGDGGQATAADIKCPGGVNLDSAGNIYIADLGCGYQVIRKITVSTGIISTVAGVASTSVGYNGDNIQATAAKFYTPDDVALDSYGNLYISDRFNYRIRKVDVSTGVITTVVGTGTASSTGDGSAATSATINGPCSVHLDSADNLYLSECSGARIRKVVTISTEAPTTTPTYLPSYYPSLSPHSISVISTIAGTGSASYSGDNGKATSAAMYSPHGVAIDSSGNVYFSDCGNNRVRKITASTGIITTYAGTGSASFSGDGGVASSAALNNPNGLCIDTTGNLYFTDFVNHRIRKVLASTSVISTIAGTGSTSYSGDNSQATSATLYYPIGVNVDSSGNVYIGDYYNHRVRKITTSTGVIQTIAGTGTAGYSGDNGQATAALIKNPAGVNLDASLNIYFGDYLGYNVVRKITVSTGIITTVAGTGSTSGGYNGDNIQATAAKLNSPHDVVLDSYGNLYIADEYNQRIRKVTISTGVITSIVGTGTASSTGDGSAATAATVYDPCNIRFDSSGNYYVAECSGNRVRKVVTVSTDIPTAAPSVVPTALPTALPTPLPGEPTLMPSTAHPTISPTRNPSTVPTASPSVGSTFIPTTIPTLTPTYYPSLSPHSISIISTIAGTGASSYSGDGGQATSASFSNPSGIALDSSGNVFFAEWGNHRIRKITVSTGIITTFAGTGTSSYSGDGGAASSATLYHPNGLCIDAAGNIYIADESNYRVRKVTVSTGIISTLAGTGSGAYSGDNGQASNAALNNPAGVAVDSSGNVYIADNYNYRIRKVTVSTSVITTIAGTGVAGYSGDNGQATAAGIKLPHAYNVIRKITVATGIITTVAGTGSTAGGYNGDNMQATAATLNTPHDVVVDNLGNIYISDRYNNRIRKVDASTGVISTFVGSGTGSSTGDGSAASSANVYGPCFSRFDSAGNFYIAECDGNRIRKVVTVSTGIPSVAPTAVPSTSKPSVTPSTTSPSTATPSSNYPSLSPSTVFIITTVAGTGSGSYSGDGGAATSAGLSVQGLFLDSSGNIYIADLGYNRIRKVTVSTGIITTLAGSSTSGGYGGDNGQATSATLNSPRGVALDSSEAVMYIADLSNNRIRKVVLSTGIITTFAGTGSQGYTGDGGQATSATFYEPVDVVVDAAGNVYTAEYYNHVVRKINVSTGVITRFVGTGSSGYSGDNGQATAAALNYPHGLAIDASGNVYIADLANHRVRKVTVSTGIITTIAGTGTSSYSGDNGPATSASLYQSLGVGVDAAGNVYIADAGNQRVRKVTISSGIITTFAGTGSGTYSGDNGPASSAAVSTPCGIRIDSSGNVYIGDRGNARVRKVVVVSTATPSMSPTMVPSTATPSSNYPSLSPSTESITTIAGTGTGTYSGDNGAATSAELRNPNGVALDSSGNVYIADSYNSRIRKVTVSTGIITTFAGTGGYSYSGDNGAATSAALNIPQGLALDSAGNVYIADSDNSRVRKVTVSTSIITLTAGTGSGCCYSGDNGPATSAALYYLLGVALDASGNVYIPDYRNNRIRKVTISTGIITTIAGTGTDSYSGDNGPATSAALYNPKGVAIDALGNVYIADTKNNRIRKVTVSTGIITSLAGTGTDSYSGDNGQATSATLNNPFGVALDASGNVYIGDYGNHCIRKVTVSTGIITTIAGTGISSYSGDNGPATSATLNYPAGVALDSSGNVYIADGGNNRIRKVTAVSTNSPSASPTRSTTTTPTSVPTSIPTSIPTGTPTSIPTSTPTSSVPTVSPSGSGASTLYPSVSPSAVYVITTVAGSGLYNGDGGAATSATVKYPYGVTLDSSGNVYIADCDNNAIRKITVSTGVITTIAGTSVYGYSGDGGAATSALLTCPKGVALDAAGNVYFSSPENNVVRKVTVSTGIISTIAGTDTEGYSGDGGPATSAELNYPFGIIADSQGNMFIADNSNHRIRKVTVSTGIITTFAGTGAHGYSGDGGAATAAELYSPYGVAVDSSDNLYIADGENNVIRKVTVSTGIITSIVGAVGDTYSYYGGPSTVVDLRDPCGVTLDSSGNVYIADSSNNFIRKLTVSTGVVTTIAGTGTDAYSGDGGMATSAALNDPVGIAVDSSGNVYIADSENLRVRKVTISSGIIATIAGTGETSYTGDGGAATSAGFSFPTGVALDDSGNIYVADTANSRIRKVTISTGIITTIAGSGGEDYSGDGGEATSATLQFPYDIALDASVNVYIADRDNNCIRKVTASTGIISTIAGTGGYGYSGDNGAATSATLKSSSGVALDLAGNVYIADTENNRIRKVTELTGVISTIAGTGTASYSGDNGQATSATLCNPEGVALDSAGNVYIADKINNRIRKVTVSTGIITTIAGTGTGSYSGDNGPATSAALNTPVGIALDAAGNVYIADYSNDRIRKVTVSTGIITTFAGTGATSYSGDGGAATSAELDGPIRVALDLSGNLYLSDSDNYRIRKVTMTATGYPSVTPTLAPSPASSSYPSLSPSTAFIITTVAGSGFNIGDGGAATSAIVSLPIGVATDAAGNVYFTDSNYNLIRKVTISTGIITTIAGGFTGNYSDGGQATAAALNGPLGLALDSSGNVYIADSNSNRIRKVTVSTGIITTIAGSGTDGYSGDGGAATSAALYNPEGVALDASGNVYIADTRNDRIRKVTVSTGIITTIAGTGTGSYSGDNGPATSAILYDPCGVAVDASGNVYIADTHNDRIRKVTVSTGIITTFAGTGTSSYSGDGGAATSAALNNPTGIALDSSGNLFITDSYNNRIRKVTISTGIITTIAGDGSTIFSVDNGPATSAALNYPSGIAVDTSGSIYIADYSNYRIRKVSESTGIITTFAGTGASSYIGDYGAATSAGLTLPAGVALDDSGNIYVADTYNNRIRKVTVSTGIITTIAGTGSTSYGGDGGEATSAALNYPFDVALDALGNIYIGDTLNLRIRKVTVASGIITTFAGNGNADYSGDNGQATSAALCAPYGVALDSSGNVYIADTANNVIRKVTVSTGIISTIAGNGTAAYSGDNDQATAATLYSPIGVALDSAGNVYIADHENHCIRKVTVSTGIITTIAGTGSTSFSGDNGAATSAALNGPIGIALDAAGNVYIADYSNNRIRKVTVSSGIITTFVGTGVNSYSGDGGAATSAELDGPVRVALDSTGNLYLSDSGNDCIRKVTMFAIGSPSITPSLTPSRAPTMTPTVSPTEYPTYQSGVHVYFSASQVMRNVSYAQYVANKTENDAILTKTIAECIGFDLQDTDISVTSTTSGGVRLLAAVTSLTVDYDVNTISYIFQDSAVATQSFILSLETAIANGYFDVLLHDNAASSNSVALTSSTASSVVFTTALPTSAPTSIPTSSSPTSRPTEKPVSLVAVNVLDGGTLTAEVVRKKTNFYLGAYLAYFLCVYVLIYLVAFSRVGTQKVLSLYESAYDSGVFSRCTKCVTALPENSEISECLQKIYDKNKKIKQTLRYERKMREIAARNSSSTREFSISSDTGDVEAPGKFNVFNSRSEKSRRLSMNSRLLSLMMKNKEKTSESFQEFLSQERSLLGSMGVLYRDGYHFQICGWKYHFSPGWIENFILFTCINHAFFNCFYYVKGSKLGRHGTKLLYICREIVAFVLSQFFILIVLYTGVQGTGIGTFFNLFVVVPLTRTVGLLLVSLYTCPCTNTVEFYTNYARIHGYILLLGRLAVIPILVLIFGALVVACIFSTTKEIALIIATYFFNVQVVGILQQVVMFALLYVEGYYFEFKVGKYKAFSLGGLYLEQIVHLQLKNKTDFTVSKGSYLCGLITMLTITSGVKNSSNEGKQVAIEMMAAPYASSDEEEDEDEEIEVEEDEDQQEEEDQQEDTQDEEDTVDASNTSATPDDGVSYDDIYAGSTTDDKIVYNDQEITSLRTSFQEYTTRSSLHHTSPDDDVVTTDRVSISVGKGPEKTQVVLSETKIDVDNMSLADLLKQYRADMYHVEINAAHEEVDDELFEEWKNGKRKQFKTGTRKSFIKAYNTYENLFSKNTFSSAKQSSSKPSAPTKQAKKESGDAITVTENPLLKNAGASSSSSSASPAVSSMDNTRKLFSQQSFRGRESLESRNKRKI